MAKHNPGKEKRSLQQYQQQELLTDPAGVKAGVGDLLHPCSFKGQRMAVAHPCPQKKWHEWRREVGESSQQWMERVNDSEEEDSSGEEEDLEEEGEEWKSERERGMTDEEDDMDEDSGEEEMYVQKWKEDLKNEIRRKLQLVVEKEDNCRQRWKEDLKNEVRRKLNFQETAESEKEDNCVQRWKEDLKNEIRRKLQLQEKVESEEEDEGMGSREEEDEDAREELLQKEEDNQDANQQECEQNGSYYSEESEEEGFQDNNLWQNPQDVSHKEEEELSVKSFESEDHEGGSEKEDESKNLCGNENFEDLLVENRYEAEEQSEEVADEEESLAGSLEDFDGDQEEEEVNESGEEEEEEEEEEKTYSKEDHPTNMFLTLTEFRDASILTDLSLHTVDGRSLRVHSIVLAAVSSLIWRQLSRRNDEIDCRGDEVNDEDYDWSLVLGPEVDHVGLQAVVDFAYTGHTDLLNKQNLEQIKTAALALGAGRLLDLCVKEEQLSKKPAESETDGSLSAAQQLVMNLELIELLWEEGIGCDVTLEARGGSLQVHRVMLAANSDYFRGMFTLDMKESRQPCVKLPYLLENELELIIGSSYTGVLSLSWSCVFEITSTSLQLQYQPALILCLTFLKQEICPDTCLDVVSFAQAYQITDLLEIAEDYVLRQFQRVACTSKFKDLPARQLLGYLNSLSLCVPSELVVFKAVVTWILAQPMKRLRLAKELMKTVQFPLMTFKEFKEVRYQNMWSDHNLTELYEAIFEDFCSNNTPVQNQCRIYLPKESVVLIGGDQISPDMASRSISSQLWFGNSLRNHTGVKKAMEWRHLGEMPETPRYGHEVAVLHGLLYIFGGKKYYGTGDTLNSVYRYDPLQNVWQCIQEMQEKRCSFSVVVLDEKIYAIGGHCEPYHMDSVECYCPTTNSWSFSRPLDLPLSGHVARVCQDQIIVTGGGNSESLCLASTFVYRPQTGSTPLANLIQPRARHCMEVLWERLYVAGGISSHDNTNATDLLTCEVYSPASNSWTAFHSLPVPHVGAGSAVLEGKFYVLGGYSQEDFSDTSIIHRYDPHIHKWEIMGKMPGPNNDLRASVLCLPQHFRI